MDLNWVLEKESYRGEGTHDGELNNRIRTHSRNGTQTGKVIHLCQGGHKRDSYWIRN